MTGIYWKGFRLGRLRRPSSILKEKGASDEAPFYSSPYKSEDRIFLAVFRLDVLPNGRKEGKRKPKRTYRNPVFLARERENALADRSFRKAEP